MSPHDLYLAVLDALHMDCALAWSSWHSCCSLLNDRGCLKQDNTSVQAGHESTKQLQAAQEHKRRHRKTGAQTKTQEHERSRTETISGMECWDNTSGGWPCLCCVPQHSRQR